MDNTTWQLNDADPGSLDVQCTGLGGGELDEEWDVLLACKKEAHVYGPSLSKQDDWNARAGTIAGTAHTQEYLLLHIAMFPIAPFTASSEKWKKCQEKIYILRWLPIQEFYLVPVRLLVQFRLQAVGGCCNRFCCCLAAISLMWLLGVSWWVS